MLKPLNNRIVVRPDVIEEKVVSGIILPSEKEKPVTGIVVQGNDVVTEGERVVFSRFGYDEVKLDGETLYVVSESLILAVFR